jgi:hypothetical protein
MHYQYYTPHQLLLINPKGRIRILHTPFRVLCIEAIGKIPLHTWVYVEEVHSNDKDELLYRVFDRLLPYKHFSLPILF